jgi:hypothetical protein
MQPWYFKGNEFTDDDIGKYEGFVYLITNNLTNKKYIGKKFFFSIRKVKGKRNRQRTISNWKEYWGSSLIVHADIEKFGQDNFTREIISLHKTRGDCNYYEVFLQFKYNVLESTIYYNEAIGKYRPKPQHILDAREVDNTRLL